MKTTDYNTSVLLKELGFEADTMAFFDPNSQECQFWLNCPTGFIPAYDLETILEALPSKVYNFGLDGMSCLVDNKPLPIIVIKKENESLATTAGRLLVKLIQEGLIKLEE